MTIQVVGPGCTNCKKLMQNTQIALDRLQLTINIEYITDLEAIANTGVLRTPGLIMNNTIVSQGKVLAPIEIELLIKNYLV